ncbi:MAG: ABC transporter ATP-binding protein [Nitratireductor sp.]|uniref:ABC transporter ATP-binding protein n=1 Tax=Parasphingorhabdus sp. TaxID=2709688 RepID=UPI00327C6960
MSDILLSGRGVTKSFRGLTAIRDVDFDIPAGAIFGLIGPNGAGKSTLFNLITGYYALTGGEIRFKGEDLSPLPTYRRNQAGIARAFQISKPFPALTVRENVRVGAMFGRPGAREAEDVVDQALAIAGLEELADRTAEGLTVGSLRKLEVARAYATRPSLLLADEPCAGLNPAETEEMVGCLRKVRDLGTTVWLVEHDMKAVTSVCDRIVVIDAGQKIAEGTPQQVVANPKVIAAYLGEPLEDKAG